MFQKIIYHDHEKQFMSKVLLFLNLFFIFFYVYRTSQYLGSFVDELVSLTSNYNFFTKLNFDASFLGDVFLGNYKASLSSGPLSAVGSVIGWGVSKNLLVARVSNFIWLYLLLILFWIYTSKKYDIEKYTFLIYCSLALVIHPWWYGTLYSLGEVISTCVLFFGFIIFQKNRNLGLLLISSSIIFGKYINVLSFSFFYIYVMIREKNIKNVLNDTIIFLVPLTFWFSLIGLKHDGGILLWIKEFYEFQFLNNQSIGLNTSDGFKFESIVTRLNNSEVVNWNVSDFLRVLVVPGLLIAMLFFKKLFKNEILRNTINPIIFSTIPIYLWFWLSSPTKWIRYSQNFLLLGLLTIIFCISYKRNLTVFEVIFSSVVFSVFLSSDMLFIAFYILGILIFIIFFKKLSSKNVNLFILIFLLISLVNSSYEVTEKEKRIFDLDKCKIELNSKDCFNSYMEN